MASGNSERGQRVRVGLTGLAAVLVIVAAVAAIFESATDDPATVAVAENGMSNDASSVDEPLAQIGVVPSSETANQALDLVPETPPEPIEPVPPPAAAN